MPKPRTRRTTVPPQKETIEDSAADALQSAVSMLQCLLPRVVELADEGKSLKELLQILDTVGKTSSRLSALLKTQKQMTGGENLADFLNQALAEVVQELGENAGRRSGAAG
ncbi:MAG: hypothetical protein WCG34_07040 [Leptolinea sp.]